MRHSARRRRGDGHRKGDIHDIGKNLVGMMLKGAGFHVVDLGVNVSLQKFQAAIEQHQPDLVGMSALLTTTTGQMKVNIEAFDKAGLFERLRVMMGGAPVSQDYARAAGAHGYGKDASTAAIAGELSKSLDHQCAHPHLPLPWQPRMGDEQFPGSATMPSGPMQFCV